MKTKILQTAERVSASKVVLYQLSYFRVYLKLLLVSCFLPRSDFVSEGQGCTLPTGVKDNNNSLCHKILSPDYSARPSSK